MIQFVKVNDEVLNRLPSIIKLLFEIYGENVVDVYAVQNNKQFGFLAVRKGESLYIDDKGYKAFTIGPDNEIVFYKGKNYDVFFDSDVVTFRDKKGFVYGLSFDRLDNEEEGYNGEIVFNQYNSSNDMFCQTRYLQMYNVIDGKAPIYSYHTKEPRGVYLEEKRSEKKFKFGRVPSSIQSYNMYTFERDTIDYNRMLIHDHGIMKYLSTDKYALERTGKIQKFIKCKYVFGDRFFDGWPFPSIHNKREVLDKVKENGFMISIPEEMIEFYNGYNYDFNNIKEIVKAFKQYEKKDDYEIELTLKKDEEQ